MTSPASAVTAGPPQAVVLRHTLTNQRRTMTMWSAAFAALIALYAVIWPAMRGNTQWRQLFDTLPKGYKALFTVGGSIDLSTPAGYLGVELVALSVSELLCAVQWP